MTLKQLTDYGNEFQIKIIVNILQNNISYLDILELKAEHFNNRYNPLYTIIYDYISKYNTSPSVNTLVQEIRKLEQNELGYDINFDDMNQVIQEVMNHYRDQDLDYVKDEVISFIKQRSLENIMIESANAIESHSFEYNKVIDKISNVMIIGEQNNIGKKFSDTVANRYSETERKVVSTGQPIIDDLLDGGLGKGELGIIGANSGVGKCIDGKTEIEIEYEQIGLLVESKVVWVNSWDFDKYWSPEQKHVEAKTIQRKVKIKTLFDEMNIPNEENALYSPSFDIKVKTPYGYKRIKNLFRTEKQKTVRTYFSNNKNLKTSPNHRIKNSNDEWVFVKDLKYDDKIKTENGTVKVRKQYFGKMDEILYDISVEDVHCYYSNGILSHNSWILADFGYAAFKSGKNVLHYTLELSAQYTNLRYDAIMMRQKSRILKMKQPEIIAKIKSITNKYGNELIVKEYPTKFVTPQVILAHVKQLKGIGFVPDLIIIDYADLFISEKYSNSDSTYLESGNIYERLRGIARILEVPCWSASQMNRANADNDVSEGHNISDSYKKVMTVDVFITVSRKLKDKSANTARIHIAKNRFGQDGQTYNANFDVSIGKLDILEQYTIESQQVQQKIKSNSEVDKLIAGVKINILNKKNENKAELYENIEEE